jgi:UrcA family protein
MNTKLNRFNVITLTLTSLLGFGAAMAAADADAAPAADAPSVTVSYRDLDLTRSTDVQKLYRRLQHAAASVCSGEPAGEQFARHLAWQHCYNDALDSAVLQVRSPELLAFSHAQSTRES